MKKCMGVKVAMNEKLEKIKCQSCQHLARGKRGADDDKITDWVENPEMPCKMFKEMEK